MVQLAVAFDADMDDWTDYMLPTKTMQAAVIAGFTSGERDYIRRELGMFFSTLPIVADGFLIKSWRRGAQARQPKMPLPCQGAGRTRPDAA